MDCPLIEPELPGYHLGTLDAAARRQVEEHLPACAECVRAFVGIKRALEDAAAATARPSELLRARLRQDVAREVAPWRRLARRSRPAVGLAAAAVMLVAVTAWLSSGRGGSSAPGLAVPTAAAPVNAGDPQRGTTGAPDPAAPSPQVDSARAEPVTLSVL